MDKNRFINKFLTLLKKVLGIFQKEMREFSGTDKGA